MRRRKPAPVPGARWRVLAHNGQHRVSIQDAGVFDEVCVDAWLHVEQMSRNTWWMRVGDHVLWVTVGKDGTAQKVTHKVEP